MYDLVYDLVIFDLEEVSQLLSLKVIANEFLACLILGRYIRDGVISVSMYKGCG